MVEDFKHIWADYDPEGSGFLHVSEASSFVRNLIEKKCEMLPPRASDLMYNPVMISELIEHLNLRLYKKF